MTDTMHDLMGKDYFDCEKLHSRLSIEACIKRQEAAREKEWKYMGCKDCPQGQKNKEASGMDHPENNDTILCKECNKRPAVLRKDTHKPVNGLCIVCRVSKSKKTNAEKKTASKKTDQASVKLDLTEIMQEYPDVMEALKKAAKDNMRPLVYQAACFIREATLRSQQ